MTPSTQAKAAGLASLAELSKITHVGVKTLRDWHKSKPERFAFLCRAAMLVKLQDLQK